MSDRREMLRRQLALFNQGVRMPGVTSDRRSTVHRRRCTIRRFTGRSVSPPNAIIRNDAQRATLVMASRPCNPSISPDKGPVGPQLLRPTEVHGAGLCSSGRVSEGQRRAP